MALWPQFRSPLVWDMFAVLTYGLVSLLFWYMGLIPDLATLRDRATRPLPRKVYGFLALGWRGSAYHWRRYESAYFLVAALATPLVISVHSIVGLDFAVSVIPGWYSGNRFEQFLVRNRFLGPYALYYWATLAANGLVPQLLWWRRIRRSPFLLFLITLVVLMGM
jgi:molybdopterin-containing oxidoreductase family membrane subunit